MAAFIQFFITYSLAMMAFWILEISTIVFIVYSFEYFLGGQMFPIDIMPAGVQAVMKWLPFYYELFCPIAIFLERLKGAEMAQALAIQAGWLLISWAVARAMWKRGLGITKRWAANRSHFVVGNPAALQALNPPAMERTFL